MSNDNNQNENIKNDKFSLYTEKINPKKPKKKNEEQAQEIEERCKAPFTISS